MKKCYFPLFLMFVCVSLLAQNNVNINVTDALSNAAIEAADVTLNDVTLQTDVSGNVTFSAIADGTYNYTITKDCFEDFVGSITVNGVGVSANAVMTNQTAAPVFVLTSSNPIIGAWVDGNINLTDGTNTYNADVTEFDNILADVAFGTYNYTFQPAGGCFPAVTGTLTVDCDAINAQSGNVLLNIVADQPEITAAPVFVLTSSNPIIGAWVDGNINLTDGTNTYNADVTEFDNILADVAFGTYDYTFQPEGGCFPAVTGTLTVDCDAINAQSGNVLLNIVADQPEITVAPVFVLTSSNPIIGAWVDGNINLTDGTNTYNADVTEFDNILADVAFGTYNYTFQPAGGCFPAVTGTLTVDCDAINAQSGNVLLNIVADQPEITIAPVFVLTSSNPIIGAWVDGNINLTDGTNTYNADVTEFDNILADVAFGTYNYTFQPAGGCFPAVTGTLTVDCDAINAQSGNVLLNIVADQPEITVAPVFVLTSSNPIIGAWVDGNINLTDGTNTYNADVTEFDNILADVAFGTYDYTFQPAGGCFPAVTGTLTVDCDAINAQSGNVLLNIVADQPEITAAPVFVLTSSNPIIGAWVDGNINLTDGTNTYNADVTEFDNILADVAFGTYDYTFIQAGGCYPEVTGTLTVDCDGINAQSGNVLLNILADQEEITIDNTVNQADNVLTANAAGATISYQWIDCNNNNEPISGEVNQSFTATVTGDYAVIISDSQCDMLSGTSGCVNVIVSSVGDLAKDLGISFYPNPVKEVLVVTLDNSYDNLQLEISNISGQIVQKMDISNQLNIQVDLANLSSGMYVLKMNTEDKVFAAKILKD